MRAAGMTACVTAIDPASGLIVALALLLARFASATTDETFTVLTIGAATDVTLAVSVNVAVAFLARSPMLHNPVALSYAPGDPTALTNARPAGRRSTARTLVARSGPALDAAIENTTLLPAATVVALADMVIARSAWEGGPVVEIRL